MIAGGPVPLDGVAGSNVNGAGIKVVTTTTDRHVLRRCLNNLTR